jgi:hypothetical protein
VIADDLHKCFKPAEVATVPVLSSYLDPRYKHLNFLSNEQRKLAIETLESTLEELSLTMLKRRSKESESSPKKETKSSNIYIADEGTRREQVL